MCGKRRTHHSTSARSSKRGSARVATLQKCFPFQMPRHVVVCFGLPFCSVLSCSKTKDSLAAKLSSRHLVCPACFHEIREESFKIHALTLQSLCIAEFMHRNPPRTNLKPDEISPSGHWSPSPVDEQPPTKGRFQHSRPRCVRLLAEGLNNTDVVGNLRSRALCGYADSFEAQLLLPPDVTVPLPLPAADNCSLDEVTDFVLCTCRRRSRKLGRSRETPPEVQRRAR